MVVLGPEDGAVIKASIPEALIYSEGIAVPHTIRNSRILNSMGYKIPSPIYYYYHWPNGAGHKPYQAQLETAAFVTQYRNSFILNQMGTGKTLAAGWAADFLIQEGDINKILIVTPLSTINRVWGDMFWLDFPHRRFQILYGTKDKRLKNLKEDADFYIINPDGVKVIHDELLKRTDINHIIVDEIAEYRVAKTGKFKALKQLVDQGRTIWGLTGTPTPNDPTDAWAQCRLVCPENVPRYFNRFRMDTMFQISQFKWRPKPEALDIVKQAMQPAIRFKRDECFDLPEATFIDLEVELSDEQKKAYKEMSKALYSEFEQNEITAANEGVKMSKLIQIAGGVVYSNEGKPLFLNANKRLEVLCDVIRQAGQKIIVFVPFTEMTKMVATAIEKHWTVSIVDGSVSASKRDKIFSDFQHTEAPHVLVAHPKCMAHGLTLTAASTIVWYAAYANTADYLQANARIRRGGQKHNQLYVHLQGTEVERRVYKKIRDNESLQGTLLEMFTQEIL